MFSSGKISTRENTSRIKRHTKGKEKDNTEQREETGKVDKWNKKRQKEGEMTNDKSVMVKKAENEIYNEAYDK